MKSFLKFLVAMLCIANLALAQTSSLSIGNSAVVENLAKASTITVQCWAITANAPFKQVFSGLQNIRSTNDILTIVNSAVVEIRVKDPLDTIYISAVIKDAGGNDLFVSNNSFTLTKAYDSLNQPRWDTPYYAGNLSFQLMTTRIYVAGATSENTYLQHRNGDRYQLNVVDGWIEIPGEYNSYWSGFFNELVIGNDRYDMNTGSLLRSQLARPTFLNVDFPNVQSVGLNSQNTVLLETNIFWGSVPNFQVTVPGNRFKVEVQDLRYSWTAPIAIHVASLADLRAGKGYKAYTYYRDVEIPVVSGTYFIKVEYQNSDIGHGVAYPSTPTTPVEVGGGGGGGGSTTPKG